MSNKHYEIIVKGNQMWNIYIKEWPKNPGFFRPFLVSRFLNWIVCQITPYDETLMPKQFQAEVAISYKDMESQSALSHKPTTCFKACI